MSRFLKWKRDKGMSLIEVVAAVVILSTGLMFVVRSFSQSLKASKKSKDYMKAMALLEDKMFELETKGRIGAVNESGAFREDDRFTWQLEAEKLEDLELDELKLSVHWKKSSIFLTTYLRNEK